VLDRYLFKSTFDAYDQLARLSLVWLTFIGFALAFAENRSIRMEILSSALPPVMRKWRDTVFDLAVLALVGLLHVKAWRVAEVGAFQVIIGTPFTYAWSYAAVVVATALLALFLVVRIIRRLAGLAPAHAGEGAPPC